MNLTKKSCGCDTEIETESSQRPLWRRIRKLIVEGFQRPPINLTEQQAKEHAKEMVQIVRDVWRENQRLEYNWTIPKTQKNKRRRK